MTTIDKTGASEAEFRARIAPFEAAPFPAEVDAEPLRDALRFHHPIMRSETGPFSGCRCGQVKLGQDVIAHVVDRIRAALASPAPAPQDEEPTCYCGRLGHRLGGPILHKRTEECSR